jgi:hypothetical protein
VILTSFLYIDLLCSWFWTYRLYRKHFTVINKRQVDVWKKCYGLSNYHLLIMISYMFLVNEVLLSYCSAPPLVLGCFWTIWGITLTYPQPSKSIGRHIATWLHKQFCCIDPKINLEHALGIWKKKHMFWNLWNMVTTW